jgi:hypothetical protein
MPHPNLVSSWNAFAKKNTNNLSVLIIDNGDISKPYSKALDSLCEVRDDKHSEWIGCSYSRRSTFGTI